MNHNWIKESWIQAEAEAEAENVKYALKCESCGLYKVVLHNSVFRNSNYYYSLKRDYTTGYFDTSLSIDSDQNTKIYDNKSCSDILLEHVLK